MVMARHPMQLVMGGRDARWGPADMKKHNIGISWQLPRQVQTIIAIVVAGYLVVVAITAAHTRLTLHDLATFGLFTAASVVSVEVSLRLAWPRPRPDRISRDFLGVWALPVMLLLPPFYAAAAVLLPSAYVQLRAWRTDPVKLIYSIAALGIARAAGAQALITVGNEHGHRVGLTQVFGGGRAEIAVVVAVLVWWLVNYVLIGAVVGLTVGVRAVLASLRDREAIAVDVVDASMGLLATIAFALRPEFVLIAARPRCSTCSTRRSAVFAAPSAPICSPTRRARSTGATPRCAKCSAPGQATPIFRS